MVYKELNLNQNSGKMRLLSAGKLRLLKVISYCPPISTAYLALIGIGGNFFCEKKPDDVGCLVLIQQIIAIQLLFKILFHAHKQQYFYVRSVKIVKHPVFTLNIEPLT